MLPHPVLPAQGSLSLEQSIWRTAAAFEAANLDFGHGTDNPLDEASWLIMHVMELRVDRPPDYSQSVSADRRQACNTLIERRISERIPLAYLIGKAWFAGHEFFCDERALVPRSPLAEFINADFFDLYRELGSVLTQPPQRILDLCTGGGCIGISCALAVPECRVVCSDVSTDALDLARSNVAKHDLADRVSLVESDLFQSIEGKFDLIISNPPYVDAHDIDNMPDEFRAEPILGLAAGDDGLDLVRTIVAEAGKYLTPRGWLVVEVGNSQPAAQAAFETLGLTWLEFDHGGGGIFQLPASSLC